MARYVGVSERVLNKAPSPDLIPGIVDTVAMGIDYETLDKILWGMDQGWDEEQIAITAGANAEQVENVRGMRARSPHLRAMPPVPDLDSLVPRRI